MRPAGLVLHQVKYEQKAYWRNPASAFFTFAFPLVFLVIFASLNNGATIDFLGGLEYNQYYIPAIIAFSIISATYTQIGISLALRRQTGELKRFRTTPLPTWALVGGLLGSAVLVGLISAALTTALGIVAYRVVLPTHYVALALVLLVGAASFCALGVAIASLIPNADAAPAVVRGLLPARPQLGAGARRGRLPRAALLAGCLHRLRPTAAGRAHAGLRLGRPRHPRAVGRAGRLRGCPPLPVGAAPLTPVSS